MSESISSPWAQHIEVNNDDVIVDGQSIGGWIKRGGVTVHAQGTNEMPQVTITLMAERMTVSRDMREHVESAIEPIHVEVGSTPTGQAVTLALRDYEKNAAAMTRTLAHARTRNI